MARFKQSPQIYNKLYNKNSRIARFFCRILFLNSIESENPVIMLQNPKICAIINRYYIGVVYIYENNRH